MNPNDEQFREDLDSLQKQLTDLKDTVYAHIVPTVVAENNWRQVALALGHAVRMIDEERT